METPISPGAGGSPSEGDGSRMKKVEDVDSFYVMRGYPDAASYIEAKRQVPHKEILERVSSILNGIGIAPSGKGIDTGNLKGYRYFGATSIDKLDSQEDTGEPNEADKSSSVTAEGSKKMLIASSKQILQKAPPKGLAIKDVRNEFFPHWKSVLSARMQVNIIPPCELSMKDRKAVQGTKLSRKGVHAPNKSRGNVALMLLPQLAIRYECRRQLCTVVSTSLKLLRCNHPVKSRLLLDRDNGNGFITLAILGFICRMSSKVMITYKRKRVTSHHNTADETAHDSSSAASNNLAASSLPPKHEANAENYVKDEDNFLTSTEQHSVCTSAPQNIKEELAIGSGTHKPDKGENKLHLCGSLLQKEQTEICCAAILSTAEAQSDKLCTNDTNSAIPVSSSVCDPMYIDGMTNRTEDSNTSALVEINCHQALKNPVISDQCKNKFSPLLTFSRRVKKKKSSGELAEENCSPDSKQCSALTCSPPRLSPCATHLLKNADGESSDIEPKRATVGNSGLPIQTEHSHERESLHVVKSSVQHVFPSQIAEVVNQLEPNGTPVSKFTGVHEVEKDARVENLSKTLSDTIELPKVIDVKGDGHANGQTGSLQSSIQEINVSLLKPTDKSLPEDLLESQGSTKNVPVIVLDDDSDEKGKELENSEHRDQGVWNKNKSRFSSGKVDLNCAELRQEPPLHMDDPSIRWLPDQDQFGNAQKHMSQPIERMFFTKEKDVIYGKQQQHEGSSTMPTSYSNFFDLTPQWNTGTLKAPLNLPSELKFRIMDKVPEFSLDLSLDSYWDSNLSSRRSSKFSLGGTSGMSHKLTEKLGTYSYKRHSAPWSEEELDFLWIGVRRYGVNNWNAMLRDTRLRFSNSRMPDDLAKQWDKEQKKLLGTDFLPSIRTSGVVPAPPPHIAEDYLGRGSSHALDAQSHCFLQLKRIFH
ncbi:hypothetical protein EJB05_19205, partial [Eragrostis curvula]